MEKQFLAAGRGAGSRPGPEGQDTYLHHLQGPEGACSLREAYSRRKACSVRKACSPGGMIEGCAEIS
jgi:hypothetical protein